LHDAIDTYSCGWVEGYTSDTNIRFSFHDGSDGTFNAFVLLHPFKNRASIVYTNCESEDAALGIVNASVDILNNLK